MDLPAPDLEVRRRPDGAVLVRSRAAVPEHLPRMIDHLWEWAARAPDRPFLRERDAAGAWRGPGYAEAAATVRRVAAALLARGLGTDRPVVILSGNSIEHALLALGAQAAGVPYAPISVPYSLASGDFGKLQHILALLRPGLVFVQARAPFARALAHAGAAEVVGACGAPDCTPFAALAEHAAASLPTVDPDAVAKILFTSGSTSLPKGVITTHRMMAANQAMKAWAWPFLAQTPPVLLDWLPWNHVFGGSHNFNLVLRHGGTLHIDAGRPVPGGFEATVANLAEVSPTIAFNVPKGWELTIAALERDPALRARFLRELRVVFNAGAALPLPLLARLEALLAEAPRRVLLGGSWGLTETAPAAVFIHAHGAAHGSCGTPLPGVELKLVPDGDKLEVRLRGPLVTPGYLADATATAAAFDDEGFFRTGDAMRWADPRDPHAGLCFDGRLTEDFKLLSGTRVNAGALRLRALAALAPVARDLLVVGSDRDEVGLLLVPHDARRAELGGAALAAEVRDGLRALNAGGGGSSMRVARAAFLVAPLSLDAGEITDKGSLNLRAVLAHRGAALEALYDDAHPETILP